MGRITTLSYFISRSANKILPFFKVLWKSAKFVSDQKCELAFDDLKKYFEGMFVLYKRIAGKQLWIYLAAREGAISSVLLCQKGAIQQPIYFINHFLKEAEECY